MLLKKHQGRKKTKVKRIKKNENISSHEIIKGMVVTLLIVGGNSNNGSLCGLTATNSNNGFSNSDANIGARLTIFWLYSLTNNIK